MTGMMRVLEGKEEALQLFGGRPGSGDWTRERREVETILAAVRSRGDAALREYGEAFDGIRLDRFEVPQEVFEEARREVDPSLQRAISLAADRIRDYYLEQPRGGFLAQRCGSLLGQLVRPLERVGCYVPGGQAPLFSSLLMTAVPARVAGVPEIVVATPPRPDGSVAPEILVAALEVGIDTVYRLGSAWAIAALAYGTETVRRVDKIVGPGNRFVILAKQAVYGAVGIEALPGPTETLILADGSAAVDHVVADLLAQAEHDGAQPVLVTTSRMLADQVRRALPSALAGLPTATTAESSLRDRGLIVLVADLAEGVEVANAYGPEHLCLLVADPWALLPGVRHAGGVFLGHHSLEALGDYIAGPSHVMPTGGTARFSSFVNLRDFQKIIPLVDIDPSLLAVIGPEAARMARAEGLEAHARAIEARLTVDDP